MSPRNFLIGQVHGQARKLGLVDPAYRAILRGVTGKDSCGEMESLELMAVIRELEALGEVIAPADPVDGG